jgi:hypothetical protein
MRLRSKGTCEHLRNALHVLAGGLHHALQHTAACHLPGVQPLDGHETNSVISLDPVRAGCFKHQACLLGVEQSRRKAACLIHDKQPLVQSLADRYQQSGTTKVAIAYIAGAGARLSDFASCRPDFAAQAICVHSTSQINAETRSRCQILVASAAVSTAACGGAVLARRSCEPDSMRGSYRDRPSVGVHSRHCKHIRWHERSFTLACWLRRRLQAVECRAAHRQPLREQNVAHNCASSAPHGHCLKSPCGRCHSQIQALSAHAA